MISIKTHTKEWLDQLKIQFKGKDPILMEKAIKALTLAEQLKLSGLNFIFKGGTSLLLLFDEIKRLSIDLDIITTTNEQNLNQTFGKVISLNTFKRFEKNVRQQKHAVPKSHYKFFYDAHSTNAEDYILLDILSEKYPYPEIIQKPIKSDLISLESTDIHVSLPSIDSILGDKMTTIAPNTIGIPLTENRTLEIGKQFFDLGVLFDAMNNIEIVKKSFSITCQNEIAYRSDNHFNVEEILNDAFETCLTLAFQGKRAPDKYQIMIPGITKVRNYLFSQKRFQLAEILRASAKVAYLSRLLSPKSNVPVQKYSPTIDISSLAIENTNYNRINRVKKHTSDGFYYWYEALRTHKRNEKN